MTSRRLSHKNWEFKLQCAPALSARVCELMKENFHEVLRLRKPEDQKELKKYIESINIDLRAPVSEDAGLAVYVGKLALTHRTSIAAAAFTRLAATLMAELKVDKTQFELTEIKNSKRVAKKEAAAEPPPTPSPTPIPSPAAPAQPAIPDIPAIALLEELKEPAPTPPPAKMPAAVPDIPAIATEQVQPPAAAGKEGPETDSAKAARACSRRSSARSCGSASS